MSRLTARQNAAVTARGNVLVAAGAGTGKTHTVTARCLDLILRERDPEGNRCSIENILMVTFTEAAAAEMRDRIRKALHAAPATAAEAEENHLAEQLALLETAPISTLHSFCLGLIRRNFHALGLDPQFTVLDESQTRPLIHAVLDELFKRHYAGTTLNSAAVRELVRHYGNGSGDDGIRHLVVQIHRHAQTLAAPAAWFAQQIAAVRASAPDGWRAALVKGIAEWAELWREPVAARAAESTNVAASLAALNALPANANFAAGAAAVERIVAADTAEWKRGTKGRCRDPLEKFFAAAAFLHELTRDAGAALAQDWAWTRTHLLTLLELAQEFTADFTAAKRELGGIDFADQEQLALELLRDAKIAAACREKYKFVFVDECQDINAAQDAILRAVSSAGAAANRFLVGDVKQSIYRFRLADPRIFQDYETRWSDSKTGQKLPLAENFRSREALLHFINPLFRALMRPVIGGLHYDAAAELQFGDRAGRTPLTRAADAAPRVELHIITKDTDANDAAEPDAAPEPGAKPNDLPDLQSTEREARLIARRLRELKESGHQIWDKDKKDFRAVEYRDMVVLARGVAGRAEIFAKAFHQSGVPLHAARAGFLDAIEVADLLNLLRLLDNPLQDVPLLAVLRSPLAGLSAAELVAVRLAQRDGLLWFALQKSAAGLSPKVQIFLKQYHRWRELVRHTSLTHCLETALTETHYEAWLLAGERGAERAANVRRLVELARRYDPFQREGLFRFLRFIAEQEEAEVRHEPAAAASDNAVRLMTIHASKGLEFPVVALAGLGSRFNMRDLSADILLDDELGLCPRVLPPDSRRRYPSAAHWLAAQREKRALLGEEMRLFYVALTRARDTLLLCGTAAKQDEAARWREPAVVADHALLQATTPLDWLRLWFAQSVAADSWSGAAGANELLRWEFHHPLDERFALAENATPLDTDNVTPPNAIELAALKELLAQTYPHAGATLEPAKATVSALRRRALEADAEAQRMFNFPRTSAAPNRRAGALTAAAVGTAHHAFLQSFALDRLVTALDLRNEAATLVRAGALSAEQEAVLDYGDLEAFWQSEVGLRILAQRGNVHREMPFTARMSAVELQELGLSPAGSALAEGEFLVVQGIADLVVLLPQEIWLLDYKTDAADADGLKEKIHAYAPQLQLYALALEKIYRRPVRNCWLHFLKARQTAAVEL